MIVLEVPRDGEGRKLCTLVESWVLWPESVMDLDFHELLCRLGLVYLSAKAQLTVVSGRPIRFIVPPFPVRVNYRAC
jgi:hypothetical protein